jgi:1-acyl-sn-glycerol-3-phosphate acyltransferase
VPRLPRAVRRLLAPVSVAIELVLLVVFVVAFVVGAVTAVVDRRWRISRLAAMASTYLILEIVGLAALGGLWLTRPFRSPSGWRQVNVRLVAWLLGRILGAARRTVSFQVSLDEPESCRPLGTADPVLVLARHGGVGDSFVLVWLLADRFGRRPRVVLKDALLWDPLIDVALSRMDATFIPPPSRRGASSAERVGRTARSLSDGDALLLFPEGANWTPRRRLRAIRRLWESRRPSAARAAALMDHVLPPRAAGVLACLEADPELPVVVMAHAGLDKITTAAGMWDAIPFRDRMVITWWTPVPPPAGPDAQLQWLTTEWAVLDQWVDRLSASGGANAKGRGTSGTPTAAPSRRERPPTIP